MPAVGAILNDSFPDNNGDGRASAGEEITYSATIVNNGTSEATNVNFTNTIDPNATLVPGSLRVSPDMATFAVRCVFNQNGTNNGSGGCPGFSNNYAVTDANYNTIIGGGLTYLNIFSHNIDYNSASQVFRFDISLRNLLNNSLGTLDGTTLDPNGVRLFVHDAFVNGGSGNISVMNADGTANFTAPNQPYFQYNQILAKDEGAPWRTFEISCPNTVTTFTVDLLVSAKVQNKIVVNEVLTNPGGTILDANGEWFELYNAGTFPVNARNYLINDYSSGVPRPSHTIASDLIIMPNSYVVLGNTVNSTNNGGVQVDYAYGAALALANSTDGVRIQMPNPANPSSPLTIDEVAYSSAATSAQNGISRELKNPTLDNSNMDGSNWADALVTAVYGPGGRGTPKAQNSTFTPFAPSDLDLLHTDEHAESTKSRTETNLIHNVGGSISGETVTANLGSISPGGRAFVTYRVTVPYFMPSGTTQFTTQGTVTGDNFANVLTDDPGTATPDDPTVTLLALIPTAATVGISGRVTGLDGRSVSGAQVQMVDSTGNTRSARTSSFGYFAFDEVAVGETVVIQVSSKRFTFLPQVLSVTHDLVDLVFTAQ